MEPPRRQLELSSAQLLPAGFAAIVLFSFGFLVYQTWFHPLAKIPGPRLAAATGWLAFYNNVVRRSVLPLVVIRLHNELGPVVRIGPNEVHIRSVEAFKALSRTKANKDPDYYDIGLGDALNLMREGPEHSRRRTRLTTMIGDSIAGFEQRSKAKLSQFCDIIDDLCRDDKPVNLSDVTRSLTYDLMSAFFYGEDDNLLGAEDQGYSVHILTRSLFRYWDFIRFIPVLARFKDLIPKSISYAFAPVLKYEHIQATKVHAYVANNSRKNDTAEEKPRFGAIHVLARDPTYLANNNKDIISESLETNGGIAEALAYVLLHLLRLLIECPIYAQRLREELEAYGISNAETCSFEELQQLPLLSAIVQEAERLQVASSYRFPRVLEEPLQVAQYVIPKGSIVAFTQVVSNQDPAVFEAPQDFRPERWLIKNPGESEGLVLRGMGSRKCIGQRIVQRFLLRNTARIIQKFDLQFVDKCAESREKDGFSLLFPPASSMGMRLYIKTLDPWAN